MNGYGERFYDESKKTTISSVLVVRMNICPLASKKICFHGNQHDNHYMEALRIYGRSLMTSWLDGMHDWSIVNHFLELVSSQN